VFLFCIDGYEKLDPPIHHMPLTYPPTHTDRTQLLSDPTRRRICAILTTADPPRTTRDLAVELAARTADVPPRAVTAEQRRRTQIRLHHHQLPKLAEYGLINHNRSEQTAEITPVGREMLALLAETHTLSAL